MTGINQRTGQTKIYQESAGSHGNGTSKVTYPLKLLQFHAGPSTPWRTRFSSYCRVCIRCNTLFHVALRLLPRDARI